MRRQHQHPPHRRRLPLKCRRQSHRLKCHRLLHQRKRPRKCRLRLEPTKAPEPAASQNTPRLRQLDFSPFEEALAAFTADRAAQIEAIVKDADIAQVQDAVKAGKLTYAELTLYFLSRIKQYDETLRTLIELNPDALKEAQAADQLLKAGKATGPDVGIPVTLKDNIETAAPLHTTGGSEILLNYQPKADAVIRQAAARGGRRDSGQSEPV